MLVSTINQISLFLSSYFKMACILVVLNFFLVIAASLPTHQLKNVFPIGKITGGHLITIDQAPWHVSLEDSGYLFCSGSIISKNYILTAAHCIDETPAEFIQVRSGSGVLETDGVITPVLGIVQHSKFNSNTFDYDVAILRLARGLNFDTKQHAVKLQSGKVSTGEMGQVTGWGTTTEEGDHELPITLQAMAMPFIDHEECNTSYQGGITDRMICAGEIGDETCQGDSGGAITVNGTQVGIVSWGYGCGLGDYSGVYSNVAALADYVNKNSNNEAQWA